MDLLQIVLITIQLANVLSKNKYAPSSDESIENLLYYKDCQKKPKPKEEPKKETIQLRQPYSPPSPPSQFECPFPKMCCSLSCNNECGGDNSQRSTNNLPSIFENNPLPKNNLPSLFDREDTPMMPQFPPRQPPTMNLKRGNKKKINLIPPIGGRRDFGFTKEKIKSLIAKDDDIRKILKDLVRVTMQKVDLVDMINSRRNSMKEEVNKKSEISKSGDDYDLE